MNKFSKWLEIREAMTSGWTNPSINPYNYGGKANMPQIKNWLDNMKKTSPSYDPLQGMPNIVANANIQGLPDFIPGAERPLSMKMLAIMQSWGFNKPEEFANWWRNGGRDTVDKMYHGQ